MILASKLVIDPGPLILEMFSGRGRCNALAESFNRCIERRNANELFPIPSSLLSEGRRPFGSAIVDCRLAVSRGSADGQRVVRATSWLRLDLLDDTLESMLVPANERLVLLSVRLSSELAFRFSTISPPPVMMTGLIRSRRKGSWVRVLATLSCDQLAALVLRSRPRPKPPALLLLPRTAYRPYPSCPVPAAGPFFSVLLSTVGTSGAVFVRLPKSPKRGLLFATLGLGVRVPVEDAGFCGGFKSGIMPRPEGAGVASRGDAITGLGDCEGRRKPGDGSWFCNGELAASLGNALLLLSCGKLNPAKLLWMTGVMSPNWDCRSGAPSLLGRTGGLLFWRTCNGAVFGFTGDESAGEVMTGFAGACDGFEGDSCSSGRFFLNFCDDFRGGGLGGNGDSLFFSFLSSGPLPS